MLSMWFVSNQTTGREWAPWKKLRFELGIVNKQRWQYTSRIILK